MTALGLHALQHRGQEATGVVASDGTRFHVVKGIGLVSDVYRDAQLEHIPGQLAIGHNRYSTAGGLTLENTQPLRVVYRGGSLALAHNGNLTNARELRAGLEESGSIFQTTLDTEIFLHLMALSGTDSVEEALTEAARQVQGAYSLVLLTEHAVVAMRDPHGFRPLCVGRLGDGYVVASETCALDLVGAEFLREVEPGEMLTIDPQGLRSHRALPAAEPLQHCVFEHIYFSRPDSVVFGETVDRVRRRLGRQLAQEHPAEADVVIAVPDSSNSIALGYSEASGIPFELGLIRNHYVGTHVHPAQPDRARLRRAREVQPGERSAQGQARGHRGRLHRARHHEPQAGAPAPPRRRARGALPRRLAAGHAPVLLRDRHAEPPRADRGAQDRRGDPRVPGGGLARLPVARRMLAAERDPRRFCRACFTGQYPVPVDPTAGKLALEQMARVPVAPR
jgi:amidophosphoribosyltransferase